METISPLRSSTASLKQSPIWFLTLLSVLLGLAGCRQFDQQSGGSAPLTAQAPAEPAQIAWASDRTGNFDIYLMAADGTNIQNLTQSPGNDSDPQWSADASKIAFYSDRDGNNEIYAMDADGRNPANLTQDPAEDTAPSWSPDGGRIAFSSNRDGNYEIYVMDFDGRNPVRLTSHPKRDTAPAWSPDGDRIVFFSERDGFQQIYVVNADGTGLENLSDSASDDAYPAWSPDGSQIAFHSNQTGSAEIHVMDADGANVVQLTNLPNTSVLAPSWSTGGKRITFYTWDGPGQSAIRVIDPDGSNLDTLLEARSENYDPSWSPGDTPEAALPLLTAAPCAGGAKLARTLCGGVANTGATKTAELNAATVVDTPGDAA